MIRHIFRKDLKLLWRMAVGVFLINLIDRAIQSGPGIFRNARVSPAVVLSGLLGTVSLLATGVLIVMAVQQDSIPGLTQDWLVRPIRRRYLLLSKVLFVALVVQAPIFLIEVGQCLAAGFPIGPSLTAPLSRSLWMFLAMDLPVLAFATLTRSLTQAASFGIAIIVGYATFTSFTQIYLRLAPVSIWIKDVAQVIWGLLGVAAILALQYGWRKTARGRWAFGAAALVWLAVQVAPWQSAFAIEERLSSLPSTANQVQIAFEPNGTFHSQAAESARSSLSGEVDLWLPLSVSGLSEDQLLISDSAAARLIGPDGTKFDLGSAGSPPQIDTHDPSQQLVWVPADIYDRLKYKPVGVQIDYSLTLVQANRQLMPAGAADRWLEGIGRCATRPSAGHTWVELGCLAPGNMPCIAVSLEYNGTSRGSVSRPGCNPDYFLFPARVNGDSIGRYARELPVVGPSVKDAQVVFTTYHPLAHFTRQVVARNIRLSDWRSE